MYRSLLSGRRVPVLLDNAHSAEQVRPLLPGTAGCLVVTSRDRLSGMVARDGARRLDLDVLSPRESVTLLRKVAGAARVEAEPEAAAELARLCAHLPLALRIAATRLTDQPHPSIAGYLAELAAGNRLAALATGGDRETAVRAAFDLSYSTLSDGARRLFRLLGTVPGQDFSATAAAALAGLPGVTAAGLLDELTAPHLVEQGTGGRFGFHDLLRLYAWDRAAAEDPEAERGAALQGLLDWYLGGARAAAGLLYPQMLRLPEGGAGPLSQAPEHADAAAAVAWLEAERANLVAAIRHAAEHGSRRSAWTLADALRGFFWLRWHTVDWLTAANGGLAAAAADGDLPGQAAAELSLGSAYGRVGRPGHAMEHCARAVALSRQAGWADGEAAGLGSLALVHWKQGRLAEAAEHLTRALETYRRTGLRAGQATCLGNLGNLYYELGQLERAAEHCAQGLDLHRAIGSRVGEALALLGLGSVSRLLGRLDPALEELRQSLAIARAVGDQSTEADALTMLAGLHRDAGRESTRPPTPAARWRSRARSAIRGSRRRR
jgi:tetratricopeptide (TPR) repeat protein